MENKVKIYMCNGPMCECSVLPNSAVVVSVARQRHRLKELKADPSTISHKSSSFPHTLALMEQ